ncbi:MAG: hypothetical protein P4L39_07130 [Humidesulfovibrio sp.]|nr:hypothetical protein [Humidesulfovibrio sp.]
MRAVMTAIAIFVAVLVLGLGAGTIENRSEQLPGSYLFNGFEPVDPEIVPWYVNSDSNGTAERRAWPTNPQELRDLLPDFAMTTTVKQYTGAMEVRYLKGFGALDAGKYEVVMDIVRFRPEDAITDEDLCEDTADKNCTTLIQKVRVGVGVRIIARISVAKAGTEIVGLTSLGAKGDLSNLNGTVSAYCYGVQPVPIDFKMLAEGGNLSKGLLQTILHAASDVQGRIDLQSVRLTPHIFSVKRLRPPGDTMNATGEASESRLVHKLLRERPGP